MMARATLIRIGLLSTALALTGCGTVGSVSDSVGGFFAHHDPNADSLNAGAVPRQMAGKLPKNASEKPIVLPVASQDINCPEVDIADGGASLRVGGPENASVRYQFNIGDTARQCDPAGPGQAAVKIGVAGDVVIGPGGRGRDLQRASEDHGDAPGRQLDGLFPDIPGGGDDGRGQGGGISHCDRSDQSADVHPSARGRLYDHRRLRGRDRGADWAHDQEEEEDGGLGQTLASLGARAQSYARQRFQWLKRAFAQLCKRRRIAISESDSSDFKRLRRHFRSLRRAASSP